MTNYERPTISLSECQEIKALSHRLAMIREYPVRMAYLQNIIIENVKLIKEVNAHRHSLGLEPYTVHPIEIK